MEDNIRFQLFVECGETQYTTTSSDLSEKLKDLEVREELIKQDILLNLGIWSKK